MTVLVAVLGGALVVLVALRLALTVSPARAARVLRVAGPVVVIGVGGVATLLGRGAVGIPILGAGVAWLRRSMRQNRSAAEAEDAGHPSSRSRVASRFLDMELDHESGAMEGEVREGPLRGRLLSELGRPDLLALRREVAADGDSLRLLEAYLDRHHAGWRDDVDAKAGGGLGGTPGAGPMGEEEAYQVLGLQPGASLAEVREAHRRLMKRVHPDSGGSHLLAARVNEAKAVLIDRHG